jgi:hypothetical protein
MSTPSWADQCEDEQHERFEPWHELPPDKLKKVQILTDAAHSATDTMDYNLATDILKVPGQNWVLVSFVSPSSNQKTQSGNIGMKIRGVFDTREEGIEHIKKLIRLDPVFDIFLCEMYNWCLVPPDPEKIQDQTYQDETLNKIISEYRKNQIFAKEHFEERKRELVEQAADEAKKAALRKIEEETEKESSFVTEKESSVSEIMDSMVEGGNFVRNCKIVEP